MSLKISIQFLTGRYHATPWDKQVNEGVVEWPPSPWRIMRSLVSAYYRMLERPERSAMLQLMTCLVEQPPSYILPDYTAAHTRHFMPLWKEGKETTTKVIDTFYALPGGALNDRAVIHVIWPQVKLDPDLSRLLEQLCEGVSYLGRAESWVEMVGTDLVPDKDKEDINARPIETETMANRLETVSKVLLPLNESEMKGFVAAMGMLPPPKKGKGMWTAPQDVLEALELDIGKLHSQGWHGIPGSRWGLYAFTKATRTRSTAGATNSSKEPPVLARFALSSKVLPRITVALSVGERLHQSLVAWSRDEQNQADRVFTGQDDLGESSKLNHNHAFYLPECNDRGEITHLVVYAPGGFKEMAMFALQRIEKVWGSEGFDLVTDLVSLGKNQQSSAPSSGRAQVTGESAKWRSLTPFLLTRFPKLDRRNQPKLIAGMTFQADGPEDQALRLMRQLPHISQQLQLDTGERVASDDGEWLGWQNADGLIVVQIRCVDRGWLDCDPTRNEQRYPQQRFQRDRLHGKGVKSLSQGYWLEVQFNKAVMGPIALGYGAHFGLGVLACADG